MSLVNSLLTQFKYKLGTDVKIVALTGFKREGKDIMAHYFVSTLGFTRYAFADPLKQACQIIFRFTPEQVDGESKEKSDPRWAMVSPRTCFQLVGTELFREKFVELLPELHVGIGSAIWIYRFLLWLSDLITLNRARGRETRVVITDLRFLDEAEILQELGCVVIRVVRDIAYYLKCMEKMDGDIHKSERETLLIKENLKFENTRSTLRGCYEDMEHFIIPFIMKNKKRTWWEYLTYRYFWWRLSAST